MNSYTVPAKSIYNIHNEKISVIIPAAGAGKRMKYVGAKALIDISNTNETLIERQIRLILELYPNAEIIITIGFYADKIYKLLKRKYPVRFVLNNQYENTNVVYSIALGLYSSVRDNVIIIYGDLVFNRETINNIVSVNESKTIIDTHKRLNTDTVGIIYNDNKVLSLAYDIPNKWGQIVSLQNKELFLFEQMVMNSDYSNLYGYEILNKVIEKGGNIVAEEPTGMKIVEIDTPKDIEKISGVIN
jgi:choline kinase